MATLLWLKGPFSKRHSGIDIRLNVSTWSELLERIAVSRDDLFVFVFVFVFVFGTVPGDARTGSGTRRAAEAQFEAAGPEPNVRFELGANEAVKHAVMAGLGIAVLSRGTGQLELDHGNVVELAVEGFPLLHHWSLAWNPQRALTVAAAALRDALQVPSQIR